MILGWIILEGIVACVGEMWNVYKIITGEDGLGEFAVGVRVILKLILKK
jgi:hypothetical protein